MQRDHGVDLQAREVAQAWQVLASPALRTLIEVEEQRAVRAAFFAHEVRDRLAGAARCTAHQLIGDQAIGRHAPLVIGDVLARCFDQLIGSQVWQSMLGRHREIMESGEAIGSRYVPC